MIRAHCLTKTFTRKKDVVEAVKGIDLEVEVGVLGAEHEVTAGESTTLRMLTSLLPHLRHRAGRWLRRRDPLRRGPGCRRADHRTRPHLVILRDPFTLIFSLLQPLVFLGLFGPLLDGTLSGQSIDGANALQWFLPGLLAEDTSRIGPLRVSRVCRRPPIDEVGLRLTPPRGSSVCAPAAAQTP